MIAFLRSALHSFAAGLGDAACCASLLALFLSLFDVPHAVALAVAAWALFLAVQAMINELLLRRGVSGPVFAAFNAALSIGAVYAICSRTTFSPAGTGFPFLLAGMVLFTYLRSAIVAYEPPHPNAFIRRADALVVIVLLLVFASFGLDKPLNQPVLGFSLATYALLLAVTADLRIDAEGGVTRGSSLGGMLTFGVIFALALLGGGSVFLLISSDVSSLVDVFKVLWQLLSQLGMVVLRAFVWLITVLMGKNDTDLRPVHDSDGSGIYAPYVQNIVEAPFWIQVLVGILAVALCASILLMIFHLLRSIRLRRRSPARRRYRTVSRQSHVLAELRALFARIADRISLKIAYRVSRQTPGGLLVYAQRIGRRRRLPRRPSESGGAYIRRLHGMLTAQSSASTLDTLATALDESLYSRRSVRLSRADCIAYAAQIRSLRAPKAPK